MDIFIGVLVAIFGLGPALIIRFWILRKPISRLKAVGVTIIIWLALTVLIVLVFATTGLNESYGTGIGYANLGIIFVAFASFAILTSTTSEPSVAAAEKSNRTEDVDDAWNKVSANKDRNL